jgi:hypothetical protein
VSALADRQAEKAFSRWLREKRREEAIKQRTRPTNDQLRQQQKARPSHICTGTGLAPSTSAPGLGSPHPHLHRDWARPTHICIGTGLTPPTSAPGLGSPHPHLHRDWVTVLRVAYPVLLGASCAGNAAACTCRRAWFATRRWNSCSDGPKSRTSWRTRLASRCSESVRLLAMFCSARHGLVGRGSGASERVYVHATVRACASSWACVRVHVGAPARARTLGHLATIYTFQSLLMPPVFACLFVYLHGMREPTLSLCFAFSWSPAGAFRISQPGIPALTSDSTRRPFRC